MFNNVVIFQKDVVGVEKPSTKTTAFPRERPVSVPNSAFPNRDELALKRTKHAIGADTSVIPYPT